MSAELGREIVFSNVSKFYGEVLGVNKINLTIKPGITSLVGPNGSGKTTLMNLMSGLLQPTQGSVSVHGQTPSEPESFYKLIGYCTQFDSFPKGLTGFDLVHSLLLLHGRGARETKDIAWDAIEQAGLTDAAHRRVSLSGSASTCRCWASFTVLCSRWASASSRSRPSSVSS